MATMACRAAVLMYVLQHGMQLDVLLIACAACALTSRCAAGCVRALMCVCGAAVGGGSASGVCGGRREGWRGRDAGRRAMGHYRQAGPRWRGQDAARRRVGDCMDPQVAAQGGGWARAAALTEPWVLGLGSRVSSCEASAHLCEVRALTLLHYCVSGGAVGLALHWGERPAVPRRSKLATTVEHRCATAPT